MKRFYCTVCKKVKRVQQYPPKTENVESLDPSLRLGECRRHTELSKRNSRAISAQELLKGFTGR